MSKPHRYFNSAQQRILNVVQILFGHELDGLAPGEIAKAVNCTSSVATLDMWNLVNSGLAEQLPSGRYRLTQRLPQCAVTMLNNMDQAERRLAETRQRFSRVR